MYWGPVTSSLEWCEKNYHVTDFVAEFWNTLSSLLFCLLGYYGLRVAIREKLEARFLVLNIGIIVIGLGSALFHMTLQHASQQADETPMVWTALSWSYLLFASDVPQRFQTILPYILFLYGFGFAVVHWFGRFTIGFQVHFVFLILCCLIRLSFHRNNCKDESIIFFFRWYVQLLLVGASCWMTDLHFCETMHNLPVNPQGHALWHFFMSLSTYVGPTFMIGIRLQQLGIKYQLRYDYGFMPYLSTKVD